MVPRLASIVSLLGAAEGACLCIFDIDRTLTGKQGVTGGQCPGNAVQDGVKDDAYGGGTLTLSSLAQHIQSTFCGGCYLGTVSAGSASGPGSAERSVLLDKLRAGSSLSAGMLSDWSAAGCNPTSPLVTGCADGQKQNAVPGIVSWYSAQGVSISNGDVHFFDDRGDNVQKFQGTGFNARQISCQTRDAGQGGAVGLCGATEAEVVAEAGVAVCGATPAPTPSPPPTPGPSPGPSTWYKTITPSENTNLCLDLPGDDSHDGATLWLWECNGGESQRWVFDNYQLRFGADESRCIDASDMASGTQLFLWSCNGYPQQTWGYDSDAARIYLENTAVCLDYYEGWAWNGQPLHVWSCNGEASQQWGLWNVGSKTSFEAVVLSFIDSTRLFPAALAMVEVARSRRIRLFFLREDRSCLAVNVK